MLILHKTIANDTNLLFTLFLSFRSVRQPCADDCCAFGDYAQAKPGVSSQPHPGLMPNVPYPQTKLIPPEAFACKESCKFTCTYDCPRDCCQPEELAQQAAHEAAALAPPTEVGAPQSLYQAPEAPTCPSPCPGDCYPSCTVACCTSALGLPADNNAMQTPQVRSSDQPRFARHSLGSTNHRIQRVRIVMRIALLTSLREIRLLRLSKTTKIILRTFFVDKLFIEKV